MEKWDLYRYFFNLLKEFHPKADLLSGVYFSLYVLCERLIFLY